MYDASTPWRGENHELLAIPGFYFYPPNKDGLVELSLSDRWYVATTGRGMYSTMPVSKQMQPGEWGDMETMFLNDNIPTHRREDAKLPEMGTVPMDIVGFRPEVRTYRGNVAALYMNLNWNNIPENQIVEGEGFKLVFHAISSHNNSRWLVQYQGAKPSEEIIAALVPYFKDYDVMLHLLVDTFYVPTTLFGNYCRCYLIEDREMGRLFANHAISEHLKSVFVPFLSEHARTSPVIVNADISEGTRIGPYHLLDAESLATGLIGNAKTIRNYLKEIR